MRYLAILSVWMVSGCTTWLTLGDLRGEKPTAVFDTAHGTELTAQCLAENGRRLPEARADVIKAPDGALEVLVYATDIAGGTIGPQMLHAIARVEASGGGSLVTVRSQPGLMQEPPASTPRAEIKQRVHRTGYDNYVRSLTDGC